MMTSSPLGPDEGRRFHIVTTPVALSPCPFCGSPASMYQVPADENIENAGGYFVECDHAMCLASSRVVFATGDDPLPDLVESWNRRSSKRPYPEELTEELRDVLGMMVMQTCPIAHGFQAAGYDVPRKTEAEQAFVLHWLIKLALEHGADWRPVAVAELKQIGEKAKANKAAAKGGAA